MGLLEGVAIGRLDPAVPLLSADTLKIRILKANFLLGSQRELVCACLFSEAIPLMWPMCSNGSLPQPLSVSGPVCARVPPSGLAPEGSVHMHPGSQAGRG